jgi:ribosomal protein S18 acetylase RimI-like enzyme
MTYLSRPHGTSGVRAATPEDAIAAAGLHLQVLRDGFLSSLGHRFLAQMYRAIAISEEAVLLVAREDRSLVGFAAGAISPSAFYRHFLSRYALRSLPYLMPRLIRPTAVRGMWEIARHLKEGGSGGPQLLSIAVGPPARRAGLGLGLVMSLEQELRQRGAERLTVVVRSDNHPARAFFERLGFHPLGGLQVHRSERSLRYEKSLNA